MNDLSKEFHIVRKHVILLAYEWKFYNDLYIKSETIHVLNQSASYFFYTLQIMYIDSMILKLAKLLEAKETGRNGINKNLTLDYLVFNINEKTQKNFTETLKELRVIFEPLETYRNKNIAHIDHPTHVSGATQLPDDIFEILSENLKMLFALMNEFQILLEDTNTVYEHVCAENGTNSLLSNLIRGIRYKELLQNKIIDPHDFVKNVERLKGKS